MWSQAMWSQAMWSQAVWSQAVWSQAVWSQIPRLNENGRHLNSRSRSFEARGRK
jgi:hypothetical protein